MKIFAKQLLTENGWQHNQLIEINNGLISNIIAGLPNQADEVKSIVIPGMVNCHSHAFQRAFAGFSEQGTGSHDSFWTWRNIMYQFLSKLTADDAQIIAQQLYIEMLKMGYTRVAEFHYLHHQINGQPYNELATMANAIFTASNNAGIGLTLLPVLYQFSGFAEQPPKDGQKRFINQTEQFNQLVSDCFALSSDFTNTNVGIAPHSLRAVNKSSLLSAVEHIKALDENAPIHIHIAEQTKEVDDCIAHYGMRPVQWLLENAPVDASWCLIHATHINDAELNGIINSAAVAGICPTTEANLGDGIFPTQAFMRQQGKVAIGSDSHISVNPFEELKLLEYAQRLNLQQRAVLVSNNQPSVGINLWQHTAQNGALSCNANSGTIAVGKQADLLCLNEHKLGLYANTQNCLLDSAIFASCENLVQDVMVNGQWQIIAGQHQQQTSTAEQFSELLKRLSHD